MKVEEAVELGKQRRWQNAQVRVSPGNREKWFVMLCDPELKSFILRDDEDMPIASKDMNSLIELIRVIGIKEFTVFL